MITLFDRKKLSYNLVVLTRILTIFGIFGIIGFSLFWGDSFLNKNIVSAKLDTVVSPSLAFIQSSLSFSGQSFDPKELAYENARLRAQILALTKTSCEYTTSDRKFIKAQVYSTYPFNNRDLITLNVGSRDGVVSGMNIVVDDIFLLGQITEVFETHSFARTIFDTGWQIPVKIGPLGTDALLAGGRSPRLTLIVKDASISSRASVYATAKDFLYGFTIGEVFEVYDNPNNSFKEASIDLPYEVGTITDVSVLF